MFRRFLLRRLARTILLTAWVLPFVFFVPLASANQAKQGSDITLTADQTNLTAGQCTTLHYSIAGGWSTINIFGFPMGTAGFGTTAPIQDSKKVCPFTTTTYTISGVFPDGTKEASIVIAVSAQPQLAAPTQAPMMYPTFTVTPPASISTGTGFQAQGESVCGSVQAQAQPTPTLGGQNPGKGPLFIPYGENNPANWWEFHPLGIYVVSLGKFLTSYDDLIGKDVQLWNAHLSANTITQVDSYEIVSSCAPSAPLSNQPALTPANMSLTNFTLADQLTSFSSLQMPTVLISSTLWVQVTNTGQSPFDPPSGGGQYTLQVILKQPGGKLEEYDFVTGHPSSLEPLGHLNPQESQTLFVTNLFFFTPVNNATLEIYLIPAPNLGMDNSILSKAINVQQHPDSFQACAATVVKAMVKVAGADCSDPSMANINLGLVTMKCGDDSVCIDRENAKWVIGCVLSKIPTIGDVLSLMSDALSEMSDSSGKPPACIIVSDWLNATLQEAIRKGYDVNGILTESPVYPLVTNEAGQRAGFLGSGQIVNEIPDSQVLTLGERRYILFPGNGTSRVDVLGYANGTMNLYATFAQGVSSGTSVKYSNVQIIQGMKGTLTSSDNQYLLGIDANGDSITDRSIHPDEIQSITENGATTQFAATPSSMLSSPIPPSHSMDLPVILVVLVLAVGGVWIYSASQTTRHRRALVAQGKSHSAARLIRADGQMAVFANELIIGRSTSCSLRLADHAVSRQHARLYYATGRWYIRDMNSAGGTYVNGARVSAAALNNGDRIRIGSNEFEFRG